jgi:adenine-specific DNA-methyltransferase
MATADDTKIPLTSPDVNAERVARLRELFPEAFTEGKLDPAKLSLLLGDGVTDTTERYGLSWTGKSEAIKNIQTLTTGTLLPAPDESVNFDATENLIIEGDNLEVLKLLQGGYHGRVKMIYIDPPYNTGGEFIYSDNYKEGLADYLKFSGQVSGEGIRLTTNAETDGRYHSKWLTMMYPRLFLARNLLCEDGVIFMSIDDHEVHNLRAVMNEIFGEENFVGDFIWHKKLTGGYDNEYINIQHEYLLVYAKEKGKFATIPEIRESNYKLIAEDGRKYKWDSLWNIGGLTYSRSLDYPIIAPDGSEIWPIGERGVSFWLWSKAKVEAERDKLKFEKDKQGKWKVYKRIYASDGIVPGSMLDKEIVKGNTHSSAEMKNLFGGDKIFDYAKPTPLIKYLIVRATKNDGLVLDFFAGSGTTAQAVLELNETDKGNRKFILVQLPEPTEQKNFPTIADIAKERVRRVIKKLNEADDGKLAMEEKQDRGFKVFKLSSSNFKVWDSTSAPKDAAGLAEQLKLMAHNVEEGRPDEALLYELILKSNLPLSVKIQNSKIGKRTFYDVADGTLAICLERKVTQETLRGIIARHHGAETQRCDLPGRGICRQRPAQNQHRAGNEIARH